MANKLTIEEQVAQLSREQQDNILKTGKISVILQLIVGIPWMIGAVLGLWTLISPPLSFDVSNSDKLFLGLMVWLVVGFVWIAGIFVFVMIKYPYYSDSKWRYINKMRKEKR